MHIVFFHVAWLQAYCTYVCMYVGLCIKIKVEYKFKKLNVENSNALWK